MPKKKNLIDTNNKILMQQIAARSILQ